MGHSDFAQLIDNNNNVLPIVDKAFGGLVTLARTGFAQPIAETETLGTELVTNGDCEAEETAWAAVGVPTSQARSDAQKKAGTYSWKLEAAGGGVTGFGQTISLTTGKLYKISFYYMQTTGVLCARLGSGASSTASFTLLTDGNAGTMTQVVAYYIAEAGNDGKLQFYDDTANVVYVDEVSVTEVTSNPHKSLKIYLSTPVGNSGDVTISTTPTGTLTGLILSKGTNIGLDIDTAQVRLYASGTANDKLSYLIGYVD